MMNKVRHFVITLILLLLISCLTYMLYVSHVFKTLSSEDDIFRNSLIIHTLERLSRNSIKKNLDISLPMDATILRLILDESHSLFVLWHSSSANEYYTVVFSDISDIFSIENVNYIHAMNTTPPPYTYELIEYSAECLSQMIGCPIPQDIPVRMNISKNMEGEPDYLTLQLSWIFPNDNGNFNDFLAAVYRSRRGNLENFELAGFQIPHESDSFLEKNNLANKSDDMLIRAQSFISFVENLPCSYIDYISLDSSLNGQSTFRFKINEENPSASKYVVVCIRDSGVISLYYRSDTYL